MTPRNYLDGAIYADIMTRKGQAYLFVMLLSTLHAFKITCEITIRNCQFLFTGIEQVFPLLLGY